MTGRAFAGLAAALLLAVTACGSDGTKTQDGPPATPPPADPPGDPITPPPPPPPPPAPPLEPPPAPPPPEIAPPVVMGDFTFYGPAQGLPASVWDVSADEGGNVYVAAGAAMLAKARTDRDFKKFDAATSGLTTNCDEAKSAMCPIVSVGGAEPGRALIGFKGIGSDGDSDPNWQIESGGADVVTFDGAALSRERHVHVAGWPERICEDYSLPPCFVGDQIFEKGRRKVRQVLRIAVNHRAGTLHHGDFWIAGTHGTFSLLAARAAERGMQDLSSQYPGTEDRRGVWEHDHPALTDGVTGDFLTGDSTAIAVDPLTGDPWAANQFRLAGKFGYAVRADGSPQRSGWDAAMWPPYRGWSLPGETYLDVWKDTIPLNFGQYDARDPSNADNTSSVSFCDDGSLWVASGTRGLARITFDRAAIRVDPSGVDPATVLTVDHVALPTATGNNAWAVACDLDGSLWVGFGWGGFGRRFPDGSWQYLPTDAPAFTANPVRNIQIDRWASPRRVYLAHVSTTRLGPGGVTAYAGP